MTVYNKIKSLIKRIPGTKIFFEYYKNVAPNVRGNFGYLLSKSTLKKLNRKTVLTIVGRGHSGTRLLSSTFKESGIFMGEPLSGSYDLLPPDMLYRAARYAGKYVKYKGDFIWDFSKLQKQPIDRAFYYYLRRYLSSVISYENKLSYCGWKIPETILFFPWMVKLFPNIKYIYWVRDPRDVILGKHMTDNFDQINVPFEKTEDVLIKRAASWKYQWDLVKATPKPENFLIVKFEDFVLNQEKTLKEIEDFLVISLVKIEVNKDKVGLWKRSHIYRDIPFLKEALLELGYA